MVGPFGHGGAALHQSSGVDAGARRQNPRGPPTGPWRSLPRGTRGFGPAGRFAAARPGFGSPSPPFRSGGLGSWATARAAGRWPTFAVPGAGRADRVAAAFFPGCHQRFHFPFDPGGQNRTRRQPTAEPALPRRRARRVVGRRRGAARFCRGRPTAPGAAGSRRPWCFATRRHFFLRPATRLFDDRFG